MPIGGSLRQGAESSCPLRGGGSQSGLIAGRSAFNSLISNDVYMDAAGNTGVAYEYGPATGGAPGTNYTAGTITWSNNIIAHPARLVGDGGAGLYVNAGYTGNVVNNIFYDWYSPPLVNNGTTGGSGDTGNVLDAGASNSEGYPDPTRTVGTYAGTLGLTATTDAFLAAARTQSKDNWNTALTASAVNDYIRAGFGIGSASNPPPATPPAPPAYRSHG